MNENQLDDQFIIINFKSKLKIGRSAIEDDLDDALEEKGEVTGGGSGISGSNIDIDIYEGSALDHLNLIISVLKECEAPTDTEILIDKKVYLFKDFFD